VIAMLLWALVGGLFGASIMESISKEPERYNKGRVVMVLAMCGPLWWVLIAVGLVWILVKAFVDEGGAA
jgi:F0F1-type ATP synthase membrane subunit c/vacuolar-type H+-ATPase subunit K